MNTVLRQKARDRYHFMSYAEYWQNTESGTRQTSEWLLYSSLFTISGRQLKHTEMNRQTEIRQTKYTKLLQKHIYVRTLHSYVHWPVHTSKSHNHSTLLKLYL